MKCKVINKIKTERGEEKEVATVLINECELKMHPPKPLCIDILSNSKKRRAGSTSTCAAPVSMKMGLFGMFGVSF
jgi:hypothetical protein